MMPKSIVLKVILLGTLALLGNVSCTISASISDMNSSGNSNSSPNLNPTPTSPSTPADNLNKLNKVFIDITEATLTEGSVALINVAVNPVRNTDTLINLTLTSSSTNIRFNPIPAQITIPAGLTSKSVLLNTIDDSNLQNQEVWNFSISPVDSTLQADPGILIITLNDNDGGNIPNAPPGPIMPKLLKEINLMPAYFPRIALGNKAIFQGADATNGKELWVSDGTANGTYLLKDIYPGTGSSEPTTFFKDASGQLAFFVATTPGEGTELWRTDGTPEGTLLLKDIFPGATKSTVSYRFARGSLVYFTAENDITGRELYISDGTVNGTQLLKEIYPGYNSADPVSSFIVWNDELYFAANNGSRSEIWKTNGTTAGTVPVVTSAASGNDFSITGIESLMVVNNKLLFTSVEITGSAGKEPYYTNGTNAGTALLKDIYVGSNASYATVTSYIVNNKYYVRPTSESDANAGFWSTDGTPAGTSKILTPAKVNNVLASINNKLLFEGATSDTETELWISDGSTGGTVMVKNINPGSTNSVPNSSNPKFAAQIGNLVFFRAKTEAEGEELWVTDGTSAGTFMLKDINLGTPSSYSANYMVIGTKLYFSAYSSSYGEELWVTDGTVSGTVLHNDNTPGALSSGSKNFLNVNNSYIFYASYNSQTQFPTIFISDLVNSNNYGINHALVESSNSSNLSFAFLNGLTYFDARDTGFGNPVWVTDGTMANTNKLITLDPNVNCSDVSYMFSMNGSLFFSATTENAGKELFKSDGTSSNNSILKDIAPGNINGIGTSEFIFTTNNKFYFAANDNTTGTELWISDGTEAGTQLVKDIWTGTSPNAYGVQVPNSGSPSKLTLLPNGTDILFLTKKDSSNNKYVFRSNGTSAGTVEVTDLGTYTNNYTRTISANNKTFIVVQDQSTNKIKLFNYNHTTQTSTLLNTDYANYTIPNTSIYYNSRLDTLFFLAQNLSGTNLSLWKSDGTTSGTVAVKTIYTHISYYSNENYIYDIGTKVLFNLEDRSSSPFKQQIWETDGTTAGTNMVKEFPDGDLNPQHVHNGKLYFTRYEPSIGSELWISDGTTSGTTLLKDIFPGAASSSPNNFFTFRNKVYFTANDGASGTELWSSDGTSLGTELVYDINPGISSSSPTGFKVFNNILYFKATKILSGQEIWVYNP